MRYRMLLVTATIIWGSSFVIVKDVTNVVTPAWLIAVRFLVAALILGALVWHKRALLFQREYIFAGILLGLAEFMGYYLQTVGITDTTPGKNAFLTGVYCVIVPFIAWALMKRKPSWLNIVAVFVCLAGIGLISLNDKGFALRWGDALTLGGAVFYALQIVLAARFGQGRDMFVLTTWMFLSVGVCSLCLAAASEPMPNWGALDGSTWAQLAYLTIMVTALALLLQNIGLAHVPPSSAGLLLSLESVFGVLFSVALGAETLTPRILAGFVCVFCAILIAERAPLWIVRLHDRRHAREVEESGETRQREIVGDGEEV